VGETNISWTDVTVNPIRARLAGLATTKGGYASGVGHYCEKVSDGCRNCFSSAMQPRFGLPEFQAQRSGKVDVFFDASKLEEVLRIRKPRRVFWCDMSDLFGSWVPFEWIAACFGVMAATPHLTHQVLTKRPERALAFFEWIAAPGVASVDGESARVILAASMKLGGFASLPALSAWPLPQVHLGVSVEDQATADERIPILFRCPAAVRWISAEPLLEPITLWGDDEGVLRGPGVVVSGGMTPSTPSEAPEGYDDSYPGLDWIVVGGESGAGHRPCDPAWIDSIVAQCSAAGVAAFVKQDSGPKPGKQGRLSAETWARKEFPEVRRG